MHEGREFSTTYSKAGAFVPHYTDVSKVEFSKEETVHRKDVLRRLRCLPKCSPYLEGELVRAIDQMKGRAAGGEDGTVPMFLKNLGPFGLGCLLECLNES